MRKPVIFVFAIVFAAGMGKAQSNYNAPDTLALYASASPSLNEMSLETEESAVRYADQVYFIDENTPSENARLRKKRLFAFLKRK